MDVHVLQILDDNYAFVIESAGQAGVIDPGEAAPFIQFLDDRGLTLDWVINTHHHWDHVSGNQQLLQRYGAKLAAPKECGAADRVIGDGDVFQFGDVSFDIIETPGHTMGHVCLFDPMNKILFSGDTIFAGGCGRLFEGTANDMYQSFQRLRKLPYDTTIYFGHEYTKSNLMFAKQILPDNQDMQKRLDELQPVTIPTAMDVELKTNPYFLASTAEEFGRYRTAKDNF